MGPARNKTRSFCFPAGSAKHYAFVVGGRGGPFRQLCAGWKKTWDFFLARTAKQGKAKQIIATFVLLYFSSFASPFLALLSLGLLCLPLHWISLLRLLARKRREYIQKVRGTKRGIKMNEGACRFPKQLLIVHIWRINGYAKKRIEEFMSAAKVRAGIIESLRTFCQTIV